MGAVYLVEHLGTGDRVALKLLHGNAAQDFESLERFKREARAPAKIQSENVVKVLDADTAPELGGAPFLVMELLQGLDLQKLVRERGRMPPDEVQRVLGQVARALDKAHAIGIVHRDLKPENLFLHHREDGTTVVKILDFGISRMANAAATSGPLAMTQAGAVMGTPLYMAPEQAAGRVHFIGPQTDGWSVGLIAIFLLTGEHYWQGTTIPDVLNKVLNHAVYAPSARWTWLTPSFDAWFARACAREQSQRFANVTELVAALGDALNPNAPMSLMATAYSDAPVMSGAAPPYAMTPMPHSPQVILNPPPTQPMVGQPPGMAQPGYAVGGSTNEPVVRGGSYRPPPGKSNATMAAVLIAAMFVLGGTVTAGVGYWRYGRTSATPTATATETGGIPTVVLTTGRLGDDVDAGLAPLHATGTTTAVGTVRAPRVDAGGPAASATATATTTTTAPVTAKACKAKCMKGCEGDEDEDGCLRECFLECPP